MKSCFSQPGLHKTGKTVRNHPPIPTVGDAQAEALRDQQLDKRSPILKGDRLTPCLLGGEASVCGKSGSSLRHRQPLGPSGTLRGMKE